MPVPEKAKSNLKIAEKIPFLRRLSPNQISKVLHAGQMNTYEAGRLLCKEGNKSTEMFILLSGELAIRDGDTELARVTPVEIVGEMGLVTNQPRSATIAVVQAATCLSINKIQFDVLLKNDIDMAVKIYKNMLDSLSQKLRNNNVRLSDNMAASEKEIAASVI